MNWIRGVIFLVAYWAVATQARFRGYNDSPEGSFEHRGAREYYHKNHHEVDDHDSRYGAPRSRSRINEVEDTEKDSRYSPRPRGRGVNRHNTGYGQRERMHESRGPPESFEMKRYRRTEVDDSRLEEEPRPPSFSKIDGNNRHPRSEFSDRNSHMENLQIQKTAFDKLNRLDKDARKNLHKTIAKLAKVNDAIKANVERIPKIVKKTCAMRKESTNSPNANQINANEKILIFKRDTKDSESSSEYSSSSSEVSSSTSKSNSDSLSFDSVSISSFSHSTEESEYISGDLLLSESMSRSGYRDKSTRRHLRQQHTRSPSTMYPNRHSSHGRDPYDPHRSYEHYHTSPYHDSGSY